MKRVFDAKVVAAALLLLTCASHGEVREWTRATDGRKITAEFVAMKDANTVTIKTQGGQTFDVPSPVSRPRTEPMRRRRPQRWEALRALGAPHPPGPSPPCRKARRR